MLILFYYAWLREHIISVHGAQVLIGNVVPKSKGCQLSHTQNVSKKIGCMALGQYGQLMILSHVKGLFLLHEGLKGCQQSRMHLDDFDNPLLNTDPKAVGNASPGH